MRFHFRLELFVTLAVGLAACAPADAPVADRSGERTPGEAQAQTAEQIEVARPIVVMLGDSLTAGYQLPPDAALPEAIQQELDAQAVKATIINAGVSGDTTRGGLERYEWSVRGAKADILLIALGANDFLSGLEPETPKANLAALIEKAKVDGVDVGLIGVSVPNEEDVDTRVAQFAAIYPELASQYELRLFPNMLSSVLDRPDLVMPDGLHPTADGAKRMANDISPFVAELVQQWRVEQGDR